MTRSPAVVAAVADSLREFLTPPPIRVALVRDDHGVLRGDGVLGIDGSALLALATTAPQGVSGEELDRDELCMQIAETLRDWNGDSPDDYAGWRTAAVRLLDGPLAPLLAGHEA